MALNLQGIIDLIKKNSLYAKIYLIIREIATVTYRSGPEWNMRFGRKQIDENQEIKLCPTFEIENYLNYQGGY